MKILKKILALLTVVFILPGCLCAALADEEGLINVAPQAKLASSGYSSQMNVWSLIDNDTTTGWSSNTANNTWFTMDLGRKMNIERIELVTRQDVDQAHTRNYIVLEVSNSSSFSECVVVGQVGSTSLPYKATLEAPVGGKYRYVRYRKTSGNYSFLSEVRVLVKEKNMPSDVLEKKEIFNRISLFENLGIDVESLSDNVTRGEAALVFSNLMKISGSETNYYTDIKDKETLDASNALCEAGVLSKPADGKYNPSRPITYHQAVKMAVSALGCSIRAEYKGGFPSGYLLCAQELGILNGVSATEFNKEAFINLLYNMLDANIYEISEISDENVSYSQDRETFLERYFEIKKVTGIVEENYAFSVNMSKSDIEKNQLLVDDKKFSFNTEEYMDLFGKSVHCYYKEDDSKNKEVIFMYADIDQSKLQLSLVDFETIKGNSLEYDEKKYKLDNEYKLLKNGKRISLSSLGVLTDDGFIELYDNDGDGAYEIVNIIETSSKIVKSCRDYADKTLLNFKDNTSVTISDNDNIFIKYDNGDYGEPASLKENDIVSYSYNSGLFLAYVGNKTYESKITEITDKKVTIDYKDSYNIAKNAVDITAKALNEYGTIYFDYIGNVFYYESGAGLGNGYGYWIGFLPQNGFEDAKVRIFTENGAFAVYSVSVPLTIDGRVYTDTAAATAAIKSIFDNKGTSKGVLIKYTSKGDMKLSSVDTANSDLGGEEDCLTNVITPTAKDYYTYGVYAERYIVNKETVVFKIPQNIDEEEKFSISSGDKFGNASEHKMIGYSHEADNILPTFNAVVIEAGRTPFSDIPAVFVIKDIATVYQNEEAKKLLIGYCNGGDRRFTLADEFVEIYGDDLSVGDVLQAKAVDNELVNCRYIYNNADGNVSGDNTNINKNEKGHILNFNNYYGVKFIGYMENQQTPSINAPLFYASLGVYAKDGDYVHLRKLNRCVENDNDYVKKEDFVINVSSAYIYFVDKTTGDVRIGDQSDIVSFKEDPTAFSKVILQADKGKLLNLVIYN